MRQIRRSQLFIDPKVQGSLVLKIVFYWLYCLLSVVTMLTVWTLYIESPSSGQELFAQAWKKFGPALVGSLLLLPMVLIDVVRVSNRFAGPIFRIGRDLRALTEGKSVSPIKLRDGDFWSDFADDFNRLAAQIQEERKVANPSFTAEPTVNAESTSATE